MTARTLYASLALLLLTTLVGQPCLGCAPGKCPQQAMSATQAEPAAASPCHQAEPPPAPEPCHEAMSMAADCCADGVSDQDAPAVPMPSPAAVISPQPAGQVVTTTTPLAGLELHCLPHGPPRSLFTLHSSFLI